MIVILIYIYIYIFNSLKSLAGILLLGRKYKLSIFLKKFMLINSRLFGFYMQQLTWMEIYDVVLHLTPKYLKKKKKKNSL